MNKTSLILLITVAAMTTVIAWAHQTRETASDPKAIARLKVRGEQYTQGILKEDAESLSETTAQVKSSNERTKQLLARLTREWRDADLHNDANAISRIIPDDYTFTAPGGSDNKVGYLAEIDKYAYESIEDTDLAVRVYGNSAIVTSVLKIKGKYAGRDISNQLRRMDVWVRNGNRWYPVATQIAPVPKSLQK